jgi:hypothetical protein
MTTNPQATASGRGPVSRAFRIRGRVGPGALVTALLVGVVGALPATAAAGQRWSTVSSPNPTGPEGLLSALSCPSPATCVAVGTFDGTEGVQQPLAELGDGRRWAVRPTPIPPGTRSAALDGVSCWSESSCTAVGSYSDRAGATGASMTLIERWDGSRWTVQPAPNPSDAHAASLAAVSCTSGALCVAVGSATDLTGRSVPLVERGDGAGWRIEPAPLPDGAWGGSLAGVSCASAVACTAVGSSTDAAGVHLPLAERWDGTGWAVQPAPVPQPGRGPYPGAVWGAFSGVSCPTVGACTTVGTFQDYSVKQPGPLPLVERWDASAWTIQPAPHPSGDFVDSVLSSVSCASPSACAAVGTSNSSASTLAEHWDGSTWTIDPSPDPKGPVHNRLVGVSCASATDCTAIGTDSLNAGVAMPRAEHWNGSKWTLQEAATVAGSWPSVLSAVSCSSPQACTAVGNYLTSNHAPGWPEYVADQPALAERWDGSSWVIQPVPDPPHGLGTNLDGITCPSATTCVAVGHYEDAVSGLELTAAERWEHDRWAPEPVPNPPQTFAASLRSVSCGSATVCVAVGSYRICANCPDWPLAEHWDGTRWRFELPPRPPACTVGYCDPEGTLSAVSCPSPTACVAVGFSVAIGSLIQRWDGATWTTEPGAQPPDADQAGPLSGVSCPSTTLCVAVGSEATNDGPRALTERWDSHGWTAETTPAAPNGVVNLGLHAVSCPSVTACRAVGTYQTGTFRPDPAGGLVYGLLTDHTLALRRDGDAWVAEPTPDPVGAPYADVLGVACSTVDDGTAGAGPECMSVGYYRYTLNSYRGAPGFTFAQEYAAAP